MFRIYWKLLKCNVGLFFFRNREIKWSRPGVGLTLAVTLLGGAFLGQATVGWLYPDSFSYSFRVTRTEARAMENEIKEQLVGSVDPLDFRGVPDERTIEDIITQYFPEDPRTAIAVARAESSLNPTTESTTDRMRDGRPYSIGIMQINLTQQKIDGVECYKAFSGKNNSAVVIDEPLYKKCVELAKDPIKNISRAREIYQAKGNWTAWGAYTNKSYLRHYE